MILLVVKLGSNFEVHIIPNIEQYYDHYESIHTHTHIYIRVYEYKMLKCALVNFTNMFLHE